jgi:MFS family permease
MFTHTATIPLLMLCAAFGGIAQSFTFPAISALLGQVIPADLRQSGNALNRLGANAALIMGSTAGGFLVAIFNPGLGLAIDAATFFLAAFFFSLVRAPRVTGPQASAERPPGVLHELRVGWREFKARTWLWVVVLGFMFLNAAMAGAFGVLGPAVADQTIGRTAFGLALGAQTLGMVLGGLFALRFQFRRLLLAGVVAMALPALPLAVLAFGAKPAALIGTCLVAGVGIELFGVAWETSMQEHVPADLLARVYSYDMLGSIVAIPLGQVAAGPAAVALGNKTAVFGAVAIILVAVVGMVSSRAVRDLQHSVSTSEAAPEPVPA